MQTRRLSASHLFDQHRERLGLHWLSGQVGGSRIIEAEERHSMRPSLVGYLNVIHPNTLQILGREELRWLNSLDAAARAEVLRKIIDNQPLALLITRDQPCPADLNDLCARSGTPLWSSPQTGHELQTQLQYLLTRSLAPCITLHGVFMEIYSIGVLITGEPGLGKSELALELISRGHRLVADDTPEFTRIAPDVLDGTCPELLRDLLEVRGLGIMDIRQMFGDTAVKRNKYLRLIVNLARAGERDFEGASRLTGEAASRTVLGLEVPVLHLPVAPGRNLAVLTEAAARLHILRSKGEDPAAAFLARHSAMLRRNPT